MLWFILGPVLLVGLAVLIFRLRSRPLRIDADDDLFPEAYRLMWLVLITQNVIAQLVTGPYTQWNEMAFKIYYVLLLAISGTILVHLNYLKRVQREVA